MFYHSTFTFERRQYVRGMREVSRRQEDTDWVGDGRQKSHGSVDDDDDDDDDDDRQREIERLMCFFLFVYQSSIMKRQTSSHSNHLLFSEFSLGLTVL